MSIQEISPNLRALLLRVSDNEDWAGFDLPGDNWDTALETVKLAKQAGFITVNEEGFIDPSLTGLGREILESIRPTPWTSFQILDDHSIVGPNKEFFVISGLEKNEGLAQRIIDLLNQEDLQKAKTYVV